MNPPGARGERPGRALPIILSVLVHAAVVALLGWGWWGYRAPKPVPQQLAIEATVVIDKAHTPAPAPTAAAPAQPEPAAAPVPPPPGAAQQQAERELERREQQRREQAQLEREQRAADERAASERAELERQQRERAAAEAQRREQEAAQRKAADAAQRAAQEKAQRESELRAQLAVEERINAARGSAAAAEWLSLIRDRVTHAWIRPPSARAGVDCEVHVTQVPGGVVTGVKIGSCNGDAAVRESIEAAVYRASPLPSPTNPDIFDRNLTFTFHPD
ncbi:MAG: cell envelope integrity protein TolA [Gammaproteobacteria bacterium]|nr:cell envelope integrity protein TolA [Gammaproteobacteria bacterium]MDE2252333.1 cell envelope integrity protein TolA [Gammaproteobacteria bacterium]